MDESRMDEPDRRAGHPNREGRSEGERRSDGGGRSDRDARGDDDALAPRLVGITGGIGTGKSTLARFLATEFGPPLLDADMLGHEALLPGTTTYETVLARFGDELEEPDGSISRSRLARIVFSDPKALRDLEAIVHPWILERIQTRRLALKASGYVGIILLDAALLLDWEEELDLDAVVVVTAPSDVRIARLALRGLPEDEARRRMESQRPEEEWTPSADWIVVNDGDVDDLARRARALWADVCSRFGLPAMQGNLGRGDSR